MRRTRQVVLRYWPTVLLLGSVMCTSGHDLPAVTRTDSAGIQIITNHASAWDSSTAWRVSTAPAVRIGAVSGAAEYLLSRVAGAVRLPNGDIVVGDGASNQLRFYDADGSFERAVGGTGGGPGEFEYMRALERCEEDRLTVYDINWQRSWFTLDGTFLERSQIRTPEGLSPYQLACAPGDRYAVTGWGLRRVVSPLYRTLVPLVVLDGRGRLLATLDSVPGSERIGTEHGSRPHPFGRSTQIALRGDTVYVATGDTYEIRLVRIDGTTARIIRRSDADLDLSAPRARYERWRQANDVTEPVLAEFPPTVPAYGTLRLDGTGHLWVSAFQLPGDSVQTFSIFGPEGRWLGDLTLPPTFRISDIGNDYVLGISRDELDVEYVELYRLARGSR